MVKYNMAWKSLQQQTLADAFVSEHKAIKELDELNKLIELMVRPSEVSIIDASVIKAQRNRPNKNAKGESTQDPEAGYNVKTASDGKQKTTYGFKTHMNVDEDDFIKNQQLSAGNTHDSQFFEVLLTGT